jgi:hypothetical protein
VNSKAASKSSSPNDFQVPDSGSRRHVKGMDSMNPGDRLRALGVADADARLIALAPDLARWAVDVAFLFELGLPMRKGVGDSLLASLAMIVGDSDD